MEDFPRSGRNSWFIVIYFLDSKTPTTFLSECFFAGGLIKFWFNLILISELSSQWLWKQDDLCKAITVLHSVMRLLFFIIFHKSTTHLSLCLTIKFELSLTVSNAKQRLMVTICIWWWNISFLSLHRYRVWIELHYADLFDSYMPQMRLDTVTKPLKKREILIAWNSNARSRWKLILEGDCICPVGSAFCRTPNTTSSAI